MNAATMVMIQFESAEAIDRAEEIAAVEGVDLIVIGTNDFLADIGLPGQFEHPRVHDAYARTIAACRKLGKHVGVGGLPSRPQLIAEFVKLGARYVSTGTDLAFLLAEASERARQVRALRLEGGTRGHEASRAALGRTEGWRHGNFARLCARQSG